MKISVILCTYNRCRTLTKALESVAASELSDSVPWEVLVVDNNSRDRTRELVEDFCARYPGRFRYLFEPQAGKSFALNTGIREAQGEILAFMDDDVTVEPTWLQALTMPLDTGEWAGAGGRIRPGKGFLPPRWMGVEGSYSLLGVLALFELGDAPCKLDVPPYGTNMAFRKEMFAKYGCFRTDLGPAPGNEIRNEDTEFGRRLLAGGELLRYEPSAVVYHEVTPDRLRKRYFLVWFFDWGRANMREMGRKPDIKGIPRRYLSLLRYVLHIIPQKTLWWQLSVEPRERFFKKCLVWKVAGELTEIYRLGSIPKGSQAI